MKKLLSAAVTAFVILAAGCIGDSGSGDGSTSGTLKITIEGEYAADGRDFASRAKDEPDEATENKIFSFAVYVFHYQTGVFEKSAVFTGTLTGTIDGLDVSSKKRVVVLVNYDFAQLEGLIHNYSDLLGGTLNIGSQIPGDFTQYGLFMSGEYPAALELTAEQTESVEIEVERVAAKVRLNNLTVSPDAGSDLTKFVLQGVSVQKVPEWAYMLGNDIATPEDDEYRGGLPGNVSTSPPELGFLRNTYSLPAGYVSGSILEPGIYFYVFPSNNDEGKATQLTLYGTYNSKPVYYTFVVNSKDLGIPGQADGTYIKRNMVYSLNITLSKLGLGADDPDAVSSMSSLSVTVKTVKWDDELKHNFGW